MSESSEFVQRNSAFLLTAFGLLGGAIAMCLSCVLKSRCSRIKACCVECDRDVVSEAELRNVEVTPPS